MMLFLLLITTVTIVNAETVIDDLTSIINGDLARIEDYPFYAYLRRKFDGKLNCGGSLIQANIVLTAAHCLTKYMFTVHVGITSEDELKESEAYEIYNSLIHPKYDQRKNFHDIGLITLAKDVVYGYKVHPIELAYFRPPVSKQVTVIGFGQVICDYSHHYDDCQHPSSTHLRKGIMNVTGTSISVIRAVSSKYVACYGDSGGPMIYDDQLVGVTSSIHVKDCTGGNTYIPVAEYIPWIREYIYASKNDDSKNVDLANIEDYPYYVYLRKNDKKLVCGGSLIQPNIVLTSAYCVGVAKLTAYVGITTEDDLSKAETYVVDQYRIHPQYNASQRIHDVALIRLTKDVVYGPKIQRIELAELKPPLRKQVTMIGFGKIVCQLDYYAHGTSGCKNEGSTHLRKAIMDVFETDERIMRVASDESSTCYGEMGDPVVYDGKLVGVATNIDTSYCSRYNSYLPVDEYISWIGDTIDAFKKDNI